MSAEEDHMGGMTPPELEEGVQAPAGGVVPDEATPLPARSRAPAVGGSTRDGGGSVTAPLWQRALQRQLGELEYDVIVGLGGKRLGETLECIAHRLLRTQPQPGWRRRLASHCLLGGWGTRQDRLKRAQAILNVPALTWERFGHELDEARREELERLRADARKGVGL